MTTSVQQSMPQNNQDNNQTKTWTADVENDPETGDQVLIFPPECLEEIGWKEGDDIEFSLREDGSILLEKIIK